MATSRGYTCLSRHFFYLFFFFFFFFFFFNSVLHPFQDYFSLYEKGQSVGGAKTGEPLRKTT